MILRFDTPLIREYLEVSGPLPPKKNKNCQNCRQLFRPGGANPLPDIGEIRGFMRIIGPQKLLTFSAIQLVN